MKSAIIGVAVLACAASMSWAQDVAQPDAAAPVSNAAPAAESVPAAPPVPVAKSGQIINIVLTQVLSSKTAKKGDRFTFKLAAPVTVDGVELIPAGTPGEGEVIDASHAGLAGKAGEIVVAARFLQLGDRRIALRGMKLGGAGTDNTDVVLAASFAVGVVSVLIQGGNVTYPEGYPATAKLNEDVAAPAAPEPSAAAG
jgi:hypothetical protein